MAGVPGEYDKVPVYSSLCDSQYCLVRIPSQVIHSTGIRARFDTSCSIKTEQLQDKLLDHPSRLVEHMAKQDGKIEGEVEESHQ